MSDKILPLKSHEVRVGNLVHYHHYDGATKEVCVVTPAIIQQMHDGIEYHPIPITKEFIKGCKLPETVYEALNETVYTFATLCLREDGMELYFDVTTIAEPKYVHQLQNLFFDLSGEQLIK